MKHMGLFSKLFPSYSERELKRIRPIADKVMAAESTYSAMSDSELAGMTDKLKERYKNGETLDDLLVDAFAVIREASWRVIGLKPFYVQIIGGIVLHQGRIAEMKTGEGKTLVATMPSYLNALTGEGVHVVTVNEYLATYQSQWMGKVFKFLGMSVGLILANQQPPEKIAAYRSDITYGTNNEMGFDYLRDNMVVYKNALSQREHVFAIVDEVDSILIDEARTPLIISGAGDNITELYGRVDSFVRRLKQFTVVELNTKQQLEDEASSDTDETSTDGYDYIVDEKAKTATLTERGIEKAEKFFAVENLSDPENVEIAHRIAQSLKAYGTMKKDVNYVVNDGEVVIVDEFTGRLMIGRRYSDGLHQAIEAKENVKVLRENKTLATITLQNYFRLYKKLSGMTGTALTEESEFREIYGLDVISIPTNKPVVRQDHDDVIYKTEDIKYRAVVEQVVQCHAKGQPVLVGTVSIEKSELLASLLKRRGIPHEVLNAKQHEKEAFIVAQAGRKGAVTIATNMAGRGTDILLGGNPEFMAKTRLAKEGLTDEEISEAGSHRVTDDEDILENRARFDELMTQYKAEIATEANEVRSAGGLYIIGTERHESRRIDNQLRGRAGRQGDAGESRFFISLEDDLMRIFGGERIQRVMEMTGQDEAAIEAKMITGLVKNSQSKVESRNFAARKSLLAYDDVMNTQREVIYAQRRSVLNGDDISGFVNNMMQEVVEENVQHYLADKNDKDNWGLTELREHFMGWLTTKDDYNFTIEQLENTERAEIIAELKDRINKKYSARTAEWGDMAREVERVILLRTVDSKWIDHIDAMSELKSGIHLRGYAQRDPILDYRSEGSDMFDEMISSIKEDTVKTLVTGNITVGQRREQVAKPLPTAPTQPTKSAGNAAKKVGRNDPCPCGSGKKYKRCCLDKDLAAGG